MPDTSVCHKYFKHALAKQVIKLCKRRITQSYIEKSLKNFISNYQKEAAG